MSITYAASKNQQKKENQNQMKLNVLQTH